MYIFWFVCLSSFANSTSDDDCHLPHSCCCCWSWWCFCLLICLLLLLLLFDWTILVVIIVVVVCWHTNLLPSIMAYLWMFFLLAYSIGYSFILSLTLPLSLSYSLNDSCCIYLGMDSLFGIWFSTVKEMSHTTTKGMKHITTTYISNWSKICINKRVK